MIYFLIYLFIEVMVSSAIAGSIGGMNTFIGIIISAIIGISLLKNFKLSLQDNIQKARTGQITQEEFIKTNAAKAIGAVLLIIPGFFTDILGLFLQFGLLTMLITKIFKFKTPNNGSFHSSNFTHEHTNFDRTNYKNTNYKGSKDDIIDVEIIDDSKSLK